MTAPQLHPDLARLQLEYDQVVDSFEEGHLSLPEARATIAALSVIDADGALWGLDEDGNFVRRRNPTAAAELCNPTLFAVARGPADRSAAGPQPAGAPAGVFGGGASGGSGPGPHPMGGQPPAGVFPPQHHQAPQPPPMPPGGPHGAFDDIPSPVDSRRPRRRREMPGFAVAAGEFVRANKALLAVAALIVVLLAGAWMTRSGGDDPGEVLPGGVTTGVPMTSDPATSDAATTTEPPVTTAAPTTTTIPAAPPQDRVQRVLEALSSGVRSEVLAVVNEPVDVPTAARAAAFHAGVGPAGMEILVGEASGGGGQASQVWELVDAGDGEVLATSEVRWVFDGDVWLLATWVPFAVGA